MRSIRSIFQGISYLQYPFYLAAIFFFYRPLFNQFQNVLDDFNAGMVLMGLGIGFGSLQDITRPQYKLAARIWAHPKWSRVLLWILGGEVLVFAAAGAAGMLMPGSGLLHDIGFGLISLALGMLGMLKTGVEAAEYHGGLSAENRDQAVTGSM